MNNKLPFEDAFERHLNDLPAPPEDDSWQKMNKLLDDNDKPVGYLPLKKYFMWGVLSLTLLVALWLLLSHEKNDGTKPGPLTSTQTIDQKHSSASPTLKEEIKPGTSTSEYQNTAPSTDATTTKETPVAEKNKSGLTPHDNTASQVENKTSTYLPTNKNKSSSSYPAKNQTAIYKKERSIDEVANQLITKKATGKINIGSSSAKTTKEKIAKATNEPTKKPVAEKLPIIDPTSNSTNETTVTTTEPELKVADIKSAITALKTKGTPIPDSIIQENTGSAANALVNGKKAKKDSTSAKKNAANKKYFVSAGVGLQMQIPTAGQQSVSYGYKGKGTASDYIPSLYFRFERDRKWFIQGEFHYGSPQLVNAFAYSKQTKGNNSDYTITTTTERLQKTFYHEIPFSFNYYIRPTWSFGVGGMYSWFQGAISERETSVFNVQTQQQSISKEIVPINRFTDSFLYRSHTYLLLQTDYQWRRFSFGLRYTKDMQPFIKYTLPDGTIADKRNWSLDFIIRFRLWKSGLF